MGNRGQPYITLTIGHITRQVSYDDGYVALFLKILDDPSQNYEALFNEGKITKEEYLRQCSDQTVGRYFKLNIKYS